MAGIFGANAKAAFRLGSDQGMVTGDYPTTVVEADNEETLLKSSDLLPLMSESLEENHQFEPVATLLGGAGIEDTDKMAIEPAGGLVLAGFYDGLDAIIAAAMGYEHPAVDNSPTAVTGTALEATGVGATDYKDGGNPFASGDIGKFIVITSGAAEGQARRISAFVGAGEVTITPAWDSNPANGTTAKMDQEYTHVYEVSNNLHTQLWSDVTGSYPTSGVGTTNDKILRYGTWGLKKQSTTPWIGRAAMVNALNFSWAAKQGLQITANLLWFDTDLASGTNGANSSDDWDWDNASPLFQTNERIIFPDISYFRADDLSNGTMSNVDNYAIDQFTLNINNNLKGDDHTAITPLYREEPARSNMREISGSFKIPRYSADTFIAWQRAETELNIILHAEGSTMSTVARYIEFLLPRVKLETASAPISGAGIVQQTFNFKCLVPNAAPSADFPTQNLTAPRSELMMRLRNQNPFNAFRDQNKEY